MDRGDSGYVNQKLVCPLNGKKAKEVRVKNKGWYVWNPVWKTYNGKDNKELLAWGEDVFNITAWGGMK